MLLDDTYKSELHLPLIKKLIDSKRGNGISIYYHEVNKNNGVVVELSANVSDPDYYLLIRSEVLEYLYNKTYKLFTEDATIKSGDIMSELSAKFGIKFLDKSNSTIEINKLDFIRKFSLQVNV